MPIISSFFGIYIRMYFADHAPPHINVEYQGHEALLAIADGAILQASCRSALLRWSACEASTISRRWGRIGRVLKPCNP